jgi:carbon monoxide dehydrogenase subunit G
MRAYTYSIHVERPPEVVWDFLTDLSQAPRWRTSFKSMEVVGGERLQAGSKIRIVVEAMGKVMERISTTSVFEPPRRWVMSSASDGISGDFEYTVAPAIGGSKVEATCDLRAHRFLAWLFLPVVARQERVRRKDQLAAFREACEAATQ